MNQIKFSCASVCVYVWAKMTLGWTGEGKPAVRARPGRLELSAVVVFTPALWLMPGIVGQTIAAEGNYLISCPLQKWL